MGLCDQYSTGPHDIWSRLKVAVLVATCRGLRVGEILGHRIRDYPGLAVVSGKGIRRGRTEDTEAVWLSDSKGDKYSQGRFRGTGREPTDVVATERLHDTLVALRRYVGKQRARHHPEGFIFVPHRDTRGTSSVTYSTVRTQLQQVCSALGIVLKEVGWHSFRKTAASGGKEKGMRWKQIRTMLGHAKESASTTTYVRKRHQARTKVRRWR